MVKIALQPVPVERIRIALQQLLAGLLHFVENLLLFARDRQVHFGELDHARPNGPAVSSGSSSTARRNALTACRVGPIFSAVRPSCSRPARTAGPFSTHPGT